MIRIVTKFSISIFLLSNILNADTYYKIKNKWSKEYIKVYRDDLGQLSNGSNLGSLILAKTISENDYSTHWSVELTRNGYFKLKNRLTNQYMYSDHKPAYVQLSRRVVWKNSEWIREPSKFQNYYRLRSRDTGKYMHIENRNGYIQLITNVPSNWWSALWMLEKVQ